MSNTPNTHIEWVSYFDEIWQLTDWLSEYGTIYYRPSHTAERTYTPVETLPKREQPDIVVDFNEHDDIVSCFFVDAEDIQQFTHELTPHGRFGTYTLHETPVTLNTPDTPNAQSPTGDLLVTQFAPFGRILFDTLSMPSTTANDSMENISKNDDFITLLLGNILHRNLTTAKQHKRSETHYDPLDHYHGFLAGSPFGDNSRQMPTALLAPHPDTHDFNYAYWKRYNKWY